MNKYTNTLDIWLGEEALTLSYNDLINIRDTLQYKINLQKFVLERFRYMNFYESPFVLNGILPLQEKIKGSIGIKALVSYNTVVGFIIATLPTERLFPLFYSVMFKSYSTTTSKQQTVYLNDFKRHTSASVKETVIYDTSNY